MLCSRFLHRVSLRLCLFDCPQSGLRLTVCAIFQTVFIYFYFRLHVLLFFASSHSWVCLLTHVPLTSLGSLLLSLSHWLSPCGLCLSCVHFPRCHLLSNIPRWDHLLVLVFRWFIRLIHHFWIDRNLTPRVFFDWAPLAPCRNGSFLAVDNF